MSDDVPINMPRWFSTPALPGPLDAPPPSVIVEVDFGAHSRRNPMRSVNDDHYLVLRLGRHQETLLTSLPEDEVPKRFDEFGYGMVVADGMGPAGEAASRLAISTLVHLAICFGRWHVRVDDAIAEEMLDRAQRFYRSVDSTLLQASQDRPRGLQTTMTAVYTAGTELFFVHVGHSRAYVFRDDQLMQLTHDHTAEREHRGNGPSVDLTTRVRDLHHVVTETLGGAGTGGPKVDIERFTLLHGDVIMLCTNGLTDVADDAQIANTLRSHLKPSDQSRALVDLAINSGARDDVTALVAQYRVKA